MSYNSVFDFRTWSMCSGSFDDVPDAVVQEYLNVAADTVDAALRPHHALPIPSGSVPSIVMDWERVIAAYRLWLVQGVDPNGDNSFGFVERRYQEVVGDPVNPASGELGQLRYGKLALVGNDDSDPTAVTSNVAVAGQPRRCWQQGKGRWVF